MVFCTLFSQLSFSLEVFADEVVDSLSGGEVDTVSEETAMEDSDNLENEVIDANNSGSEELDTNLEDSDSSDTTIGGDTVGEVENNDEEPTDDTTDGELVEEPGDDTTEEDSTYFDNGAHVRARSGSFRRRRPLPPKPSEPNVTLDKALNNE